MRPRRKGTDLDGTESTRFPTASQYPVDPSGKTWARRANGSLRIRAGRSSTSSRTCAAHLPLRQLETLQRPRAALSRGPSMSFALDVALHWYLEKGFLIFPCREKKPLLEGGFKAASKDPAKIREWWTTWPAAQIGVPT